MSVLILRSSVVEEPPSEGDGPDASNPQDASSFPHVISFNTDDWLPATQASTGADITHVAGAAWDGRGAGRFWMPSVQGYSCLRNISLNTDPTSLFIRFVIKFGPDFIADDEGLGPKHIILLRSTADDGDRAIAQQHAFGDGEWDLGLGNNISPEYPNPRVWDYGEHVGDDICFEFEFTVGGNMRYWITKRTGGTWNETLVLTEPVNNGNGFWSAIDVLGAFGGPGTEGPSNPDAWFQLSTLVLNDEYIGPPAGFRA